MPCQIQVAYQCYKPTGEVIAVVDENHRFSPLERLQANGGDKSTWTRISTILRITDKTRDEMAYLRDPQMVIGSEGMEPTGLTKYYFSVPVQGVDPEYDQLNETGEIECDWATAEKFLRVRE